MDHRVRVNGTAVTLALACRAKVCHPALNHFPGDTKRSTLQGRERLARCRWRLDRAVDRPLGVAVARDRQKLPKSIDPQRSNPSITMCKTLHLSPLRPVGAIAPQRGFLRASGPCEPGGCKRDASTRSGDVTRTERWVEDLISLFPSMFNEEWLVEAHGSARPAWAWCGSAMSSFAVRSSQRSP